MLVMPPDGGVVVVVVVVVESLVLNGTEIAERRGAAGTCCTSPRCTRKQHVGVRFSSWPPARLDEPALEWWRRSCSAGTALSQHSPCARQRARRCWPGPARRSHRSYIDQVAVVRMDDGAQIALRRCAPPSPALLTRAVSERRSMAQPTIPAAIGVEDRTAVHLSFLRTFGCSAMSVSHKTLGAFTV